MSSTYIARLGPLAFTLSLMLAVASSSADEIDTRDSTIYGRVVSIDSAEVVIAEGCDEAAKSGYSWDNIHGITFSEATCKARTARVPGVGAGVGLSPLCEDGAKKRYFAMTLSSTEGEIERIFNFHASELRVEDGGPFRIKLAPSGRWIEGPRIGVSAVARQTLCVEQLRNPEIYPKQFHEIEGRR